MKLKAYEAVDNGFNSLRQHGYMILPEQSQEYKKARETIACGYLLSFIGAYRINPNQFEKAFLKK